MWFPSREMFITTLLIFILILSILVLVHEFGHFLAAKLSKVRVEEFGLGLPPKILGVKVGETIYSFNLLPIGGFVRLTGEETRSGVSGEFYSQPMFNKAFIVVAGVLMNFIFGFSLLSLGFAKIGVPEISDHIMIDQVSKGSPAEIAGFLPGDEIVRADNQKVNDYDSLTSLIKRKAGEKVIITVKRMQKEFKFEIIPRVNPPVGEGAMGVRLLVQPSVNYQKIPFWQVPEKAFNESLNLVGLMFAGLKNIVKELIFHKVIPEDVAGPVGIAKITGEVVKGGWWQIVNFMALLSFNLGVINILPFPGLDGGRLMFVILEKILGAKFSLRVQTFVNSIGIAILLFLMVAITYYDIVRSF